MESGEIVSQFSKNTALRSEEVSEPAIMQSSTLTKNKSFANNNGQDSSTLHATKAALMKMI